MRGRTRLPSGAALLRISDFIRNGSGMLLDVDGSARIKSVATVAPLHHGPSQRRCPRSRIRGSPTDPLWWRSTTCATGCRISSVTNKGAMRSKTFEGALNSDILIDFLKRLVRDAGRKVYLILANLRIRHRKPVKAWLAANAHAIDVFYLPS